MDMITIAYKMYHQAGSDSVVEELVAAYMEMLFNEIVVWWLLSAKNPPRIRECGLTLS